jgi:hypothetical protein
MSPFHDLRAVHDMASLSVEAVAVASWILIEIAAEARSGGAITIGASVDIASGKLIDDATGRELAPEEARSGIVLVGAWKLVDASGEQVVPRSASYSWTEPPKLHLHGLTAEDLHDPFARSGTILCQYHEAEQGRAQFSSVHVVPPGWETSVRGAREALRADPELLARPDLPSVAEGDNPVLAVLAFRRLAEPGSALAWATEFRQAAFVYLLMRRADEDAARQELMKLGQSLGEPRFFVLGVCTARILHPELRSSQDWAPKLVASLRASTDPYLQQLLQAARLDS